MKQTRQHTKGRSESAIQDEVRYAIGKLPYCRLFRNDNGMAYHGKARSVKGSPHTKIIQNAKRVNYGLHKGSSDLIGWTIVNGVAVFTAIEVKREKGGIASPEQLNFIEQVQMSGGIAFIARSGDEAIEKLSEQMADIERRMSGLTRIYCSD